MARRAKLVLQVAPDAVEHLELEAILGDAVALHELAGVRDQLLVVGGEVVVDGGRGQLSVATKVLGELGLQIPHVGLAKRLEEVYFPDHPEPLRIPRGSEALFVLQHLRDEAHRFAITFHRESRQKRALRSPLDDVPGVGPARKKALLKRFGSLARLRRAEVEQIAETPGIGRELASTIHERLREAEPRPLVPARDRTADSKVSA